MPRKRRDRVVSLLGRIKDAPVWALLRLLSRVGRRRLAGFAGITLLEGLLPTAFILATGALIGSVPGTIAGGLDSADGRRLVAALIAISALYVIQLTLEQIASAVSWLCGMRFELVVRRAVLGAALGPAGIAHLEEPEFADHVSSIEASEVRYGWERHAVASLSTVISASVQGLGAAVVLASFRWWAPIVLLTGYAFTHRWIRREIENFVASMNATTPELRRSAYFRDLALRPEAAKEIRVFGLASWTVDNFTRRWLDGMRLIWRERRRNRSLMLQAVLAAIVAHAAVFAVLGRAAFTGEIGPGAVAAYGQAILGMFMIVMLADAQRDLSEGATLARRALQLADRSSVVQARLAGEVAPADDAPRDGIRFAGVRFTYPGSRRPVLSLLDLSIPAGRSLAIVGANGAGKTTLIKLLARLYDPDEGAITVDGIDLCDLEPAAWRRRVGVIFQDFVRFELPLRANIGFGSPGLITDDSALTDALRQAGGEDLLADMPDGWDTVLSRAYPGGVDLSGGQWQRVALARALAAVRGGAGVLVLDEPTANLDVRAEADLFDRFLDLTRGVTTILISHRFSSVRHADRICVLDGGRVVEEGTHDQLIAVDGRYASMFELQAARFRQRRAMGEATAKDA